MVIYSRAMWDFGGILNLNQGITNVPLAAEEVV